MWEAVFYCFTVWEKGKNPVHVHIRSAEGHVRYEGGSDLMGGMMILTSYRIQGIWAAGLDFNDRFQPRVRKL